MSLQFVVTSGVSIFKDLSGVVVICP